MRGKFGVPLHVSLYLLGDDGAAVPPYDDVSYSPDIYLYDYLPSRSDALLGTGALTGYHVTEWEVTDNLIEFDLPALADPNPSSSSSTEEYWLAIVYNIEELGDDQLMLKSLCYDRVLGQYSALTLEQSDLEGIDKTVAHIFGSASTTIEAVNASVLRQIKAYFKRQGYRWERLSEVDGLRDAAIFLALHYAFVSQIRSTGDYADRKQAIYEGKYRDAIGSITLPYDTDGDNEPDTLEAQGDPSSWMFDR